ncbi:hypothetical protein [uncultured Rhodoblastus sp.]|uniref:hypothetical protein n=1 Tax=uncultured Rhodoblastus sp. TaxID=543037 RepID=UPI0025E37D6B|nr:hypothetical protein [uncultured Rhodoblastus sp.]
MTTEYDLSNDTEDEEDFWLPPLASVASRHISLRSRGAGRSIIPAITGVPPRVRMIQCESILESKCAVVMLARRDVVNLVEQPPAVAYFDEFEQRWKRHFFDFLADMADGSKMALAVRPKARSEKVLDILKAIAGQVRGFADAYVLVEDADLPVAIVQNAELILSARRDRDRTADATMRAIVRTLNGETTVATLIKISGLKGAGYRAIARLIDEGDLEIGQNTLIDYPATVWRPYMRNDAA